MLKRCLWWTVYYFCFRLFDYCGRDSLLAWLFVYVLWFAFLSLLFCGWCIVIDVDLILFACELVGVYVNSR